MAPPLHAWSPAVKNTPPPVVPPLSVSSSLFFSLSFPQEPLFCVNSSGLWHTFSVMYVQAAYTVKSARDGGSHPHHHQCGLSLCVLWFYYYLFFFFSSVPCKAWSSSLCVCVCQREKTENVNERKIMQLATETESFVELQNKTWLELQGILNEMIRMTIKSQLYHHQLDTLFGQPVSPNQHQTHFNLLLQIPFKPLHESIIANRTSAHNPHLVQLSPLNKPSPMFSCL